MAKKPVIEIDVDDTQFKAFHDLFIKYEESLAKMPKAWEDANAVMNAGIAAIAEQTHQIAKHLNSATHAQKQFGHATRAGENGLKKMAGYAEKMADSIFGVAKFMLKTAGWGAGLFGGALFGIDKLAQNAVSTQYTARGIGITTGQQRAWGMDFKRIAPAGLPESVFNAQRNMSEWGWLAKASGMNPEQAASMNPAQLAEIILGRAHAYARKYQGNTVMMSQNAAAMMAYKAVGLDTQDVTRLGAMSGSQISLAESRFASDSLRLNYTNKAVRQLFTFSNELARMGKWIDTTLTNKLAKLGPALAPLIHALGSDTNKLLTAVLSPANLNDIKIGLNDFTKYLTSGKMENAFDSFAESLSHLAKDLKRLDPAKSVVERAAGYIWHGFDWFAKDIGKTVAILSHPVEALKAHPNSMAGEMLGTHGWLWKAGKASTWVGGAPLQALNHMRGVPSASANMLKYASIEDAAANKYGISPLLLNAQGATESSGNPHARSTYYRMVNGKRVAHHARGLMQITRSTAREFGIHHLYDPSASIKGAAKIDAWNYAELRNKYPGLSIGAINAMAIASYNEGIGAVESQYGRFGNRWLSHAPKETQGEVADVQRNIMTTLRIMSRHFAKPVKVAMTVHNKSGADMALSANAAR